jgi:hypothetical protein
MITTTNELALTNRMCYLDLVYYIQRKDITKVLLLDIVKEDDQYVGAILQIDNDIEPCFVSHNPSDTPAKWSDLCTAHTYAFEGSGSYSHAFDWDNGIAITIAKFPTAFANAQEEADYAVETCPMCANNTLPPTPVNGVYPIFINEYAGSRTINGYVIASNKADAIALLNEYAKSFPYKEYERD